MVQVKFESSSLQFLENDVNEFLNGIDEKNSLNVKIASISWYA